MLLWTLSGVCVSLQISVFISFRYIPRSGIARSYGNSIFSVLEAFVWFSTGAAPIYIPNTVYKGSLFSSFPQHLLFVFLITIAILTGVRWSLIVDLICVSLLISDVEHLSWACWPFAFPLWKNIYSVFCPFLNHFKKPIIYSCLRWVFVATCGLSLAALSGGSSRLQCSGFSLWWLLSLQSTDPRFWGSGAVAHGLYLLPSTWNLPEPGIEPVSPAPVGGSTVPPGKSRVVCIFDVELYELFPYVNNNPLSSYYWQIFSPVQ